MPVQLAWLTKLVGIAYVTEIVTDVATRLYDFLNSTGEGSKPLRKKNDTTKLTQYMYDFIVLAHKEFLEYNRTHPKEKITTLDLTYEINLKMHTHKSRTAISRIWSGKVDRDNLPVGKSYFDY